MLTREDCEALDAALYLAKVMQERLWDAPDLKTKKAVT
jgi:hypothetical protein